MSDKSPVLILSVGPRFQSGRLLCTPGALALDVDFIPYLSRHLSGDWGDLCADDAAANDAALRYDDGRLFSAYNLPDNGRLWIITEADRSATTLLLPEEY